MKPAKRPSLTPRERFLLLVLPGALVLAVYSAFINPAQAAALSKARAQLEQAQKQAGSSVMPGSVLKADLERLKQEAERLKADITALTTGGDDALRHSENVKRVGELLREHGLLVVGEGPSGTSAAMSSGGRRAAAAPARRAWAIRFLGTWPSVQSALQKMPEVEEMTCFPLSLTMNESANGEAVHEWTLHLCL